MTRRPLLAATGALTLVLLLTACGSGEDTAASGKDGGATRTVRTAMGEVEVPAEPKRVVVLDTGELDSVLTLGVTPVGAVRSDAARGFASYLPEDEVAGIENVGVIAQPNLEAVAALKPDLILTSKVRDEARYAQLSKIAATVMSENTGHPWKENFRLHAEALGKQKEADRAIAAYEKRAAEVTEAAGGPAKARKTEVNVVRFVEGADIRIYGRKNYIGTILADVGLGRPAVTDKAADGFSYDVSPEKIDLADADVLFTATYGDPEKAKETETTESALWRSLTAVKSGAVHRVEDELWLQGIGYTAAQQILDELEEALTA
ncbi:ABC transporter substrate-binding protein [Streptomyces diastaticus]|uniref:ABC transporter substrate-binding protein n=1 Tax=Streptomyces diastaticus TaxID=1956 RepID=UPI0035DA000B